MPTSLILSLPQRQQLSSWALATYPREACGVLLGTLTEDEICVKRPVLTRNLAPQPDRFEIDPGDLQAAVVDGKAHNWKLVGFWHTHPDAPATPSASDGLESWRGLISLILSTTATRVIDWRAWRGTSALQIVPALTVIR